MGIVENILNHSTIHSNSRKYNVDVSDDQNDKKTILNIEGIQIWKTILWQKRKKVEISKNPYIVFFPTLEFPQIRMLYNSTDLQSKD